MVRIFEVITQTANETVFIKKSQKNKKRLSDKRQQVDPENSILERKFHINGAGK